MALKIMVLISGILRKKSWLKQLRMEMTQFVGEVGIEPIKFSTKTKTYQYARVCRATSSVPGHKTTIF